MFDLSTQLPAAESIGDKNWGSMWRRERETSSDRDVWCKMLLQNKNMLTCQCDVIGYDAESEKHERTACKYYTRRDGISINSSHRMTRVSVLTLFRAAWSSWDHRKIQTRGRAGSKCTLRSEAGRIATLSWADHANALIISLMMWKDHRKYQGGKSRCMEKEVEKRSINSPPFISCIMGWEKKKQF